MTAAIFAATIRSIQEARRATHAASHAAEAATAQARIAEDTEKRQLRAYVFIDKGQVTLKGRTLTSSIDLKNSGQTPAYHLTVKSRLRTTALDGHPEGFESDPFQGHELSQGILGPGGVLDPEGELTIPPDYATLISALQDGRAVVYLIGQAEYQDAFDRSWILDFRLRGERHSNLLWLLMLAEEGNEEHRKK